jgi:hypothetical protein
MGLLLAQPPTDPVKQLPEGKNGVSKSPFVITVAWAEAVSRDRKANAKLVL